MFARLNAWLHVRHMIVMVSSVLFVGLPRFRLTDTRQRGAIATRRGAVRPFAVVARGYHVSVFFDRPRFRFDRAVRNHAI